MASNCITTEKINEKYQTKQIKLNENKIKKLIKFQS